MGKWTPEVETWPKDCCDIVILWLLRCHVKKKELIRDLFDLIRHIFSGTSRWETSSNKRKHENDGTCELGSLDCMVYQEYVVSFDHNYSLYNIDEGKFVTCGYQVSQTELRRKNKKWNTAQIPSWKILWKFIRTDVEKYFAWHYSSTTEM